MGQSNEHLLSVPIKHITEQMLLSELDEIETHRHIVLIHSVVALAVSILSLISHRHNHRLLSTRSSLVQLHKLPSSFCHPPHQPLHPGYSSFAPYRVSHTQTHIHHFINRSYLQTLLSDFALHLLLWLCPTEPTPSLLLTGMVIHCANAFHSLNKSPHLLVSSFSPSVAHFIEALQTKSSPFTPVPSITRSPTRATSTFSHPDSLPLFFSLFKKTVVEALPVSVLNSLFRTFVTLTKENPFFVENSRHDGMFTHTFLQLIFFLFLSKHFHLFKLCLKMFIGCLELESNNYVLKDFTATSSLATNAEERSKRGIDSDDVTFDPSSFNNNAEMIIALSIFSAKSGERQITMQLRRKLHRT
ncbi:hypothetical protein BLNAU_1740 [Blattamonas nauphoetae]|uniref:Uncharacterized protein n=1 Tax=Blattamonas nauphoetae TaxID=2049346 RepID=A0ABQ9YHJ2_9EUKA|nr:hypothetical protein BLNAU_1740 [Blattamonas nauphoetae]